MSKDKKRARKASGDATSGKGERQRDKAVSKLEKRQEKLLAKREELQQELDEIAARLAELRPRPTVAEASERLSDLRAEQSGDDTALAAPASDPSDAIPGLVLPGSAEAAETMATAELPDPERGAGEDDGTGETEQRFAYIGDLPGPDDHLAPPGNEAAVTGR